MSRVILIASLMREHGETGVQTHVRALRDWLASSGRVVQLLTPFSNPRIMVYPVFGIRRLIDRLHKPTSVRWYRHWHTVFLRLALRRRLTSGETCVVYAQCPLSARAALDARVSLEQRVAMVVHFNLSQADEWADKGSIRRDDKCFKAIQAFEAATLPQLDALIYVSDFMRCELERRIPTLVNVPARVIPNFLDDPGEPVKVAPAADLITIGTLEWRKNQRYALDIVYAAKQQGCCLRLTVVGDGPDREMLQRHAANLGIAGQVRFAGFVAHAADLMQAHRAYLHVALIENLPLSLIEALSRGLPVLSPRIGGIPEIFSDGVEGRLIPIQDAATAARLIIDWLNDVECMERASDAARQRFLERFEAERVGAQLVGFLDSEAI